MLLKSNISAIEHGSDAWFLARCARFTSSENFNLMGIDKFLTTGCLSYIYRKVGEGISGIPVRKELETEATAHGNIYELEAIRKYALSKGLQFVVVRKFIYDPNTQFGCTPDFIIVESESINKLSYNVITGEVKCPPTYDNFVAISLCDHPLELKRIKPAYYWQCIDQLDECGTLRGVFVAYHPDFGEAQLKEIPFRVMWKDSATGKYPIQEDLNLLKKRKDMAVEEYNQIKAKLLMKKGQPLPVSL